MKKFNETGAWNLPVVNNRKYIGLISKSTIFNAYREELVRFSEEQLTTVEILLNKESQRY